MGWRINVKGAVLNEEDVIGAHLTIINEALGTKGWDVLDPMGSPDLLMMWAAITVSEMNKSDLQESMVFVQTLKVQELLACFTPDASTLPQEPSDEQPAPATPDNAEIDAQREAWMKMMAAKAD